MTERTKSNRLLVFLGAMTLIISACGGDDASGGGSGRDVDVCSLITATEAQAWLGGQVEPPAPYDGPDPEPTCVFKSTGAQTQILLQVYDGEVYYSGGNTDLHPEAVPASGLGDEGFTEPGNVAFLKNDWTVSVTRISGPVTDAALLEAAQLVSNRLP